MLLSAMSFAGTSTTQLREGMVNLCPAEDLWKFACVSREAHRGTVETGGVDHGAGDSQL